MLGGIGSDLWRSPSDPADEYWMVTDRGPNDQVRVEGETRRTFAVPEYTPLIVHVRLSGSEIEVLDVIPIVGESGSPVTGIPNAVGQEEPYDFSGLNRLALNPSGLDVEGLVRTDSGEFWAVEEYGPSIVRIDPGGRVLHRFVPHGLQLAGADYPVSERLPMIFNRRTLNRGLEGMTMSPDGRTLYLAIQSPLSDPDATGADESRIVRILAFDIETEQVTAEYAYPIERIPIVRANPRPTREPKPERTAKPSAAAKPDRVAKPERVPRPTTEPTKVSAMASVGPSWLLILERTSSESRLYLADLDGAHNLLGSLWDDSATVPSLEALEDPAIAGVSLLAKELVIDLSAISEMPDKIEGIAVIDATTIVVANDNDFDIGDFDESGNNIGEGIDSQMLVVRLLQPLP
jgi:hypothetical protein